jgi:hypothetical protein
VRSLYIDGEIHLIRLGFEIAQENAWISTHDGRNVTDPRIDWEKAQKQLDLVLYPPEINQDAYPEED